MQWTVCQYTTFDEIIQPKHIKAHDAAGLDVKVEKLLGISFSGRLRGFIGFVKCSDRLAQGSTCAAQLRLDLLQLDAHFLHRRSGLLRIDDFAIGIKPGMSIGYLLCARKSRTCAGQGSLERVQRSL